MQRLMIVVPCYNEEEILPYSIQKLTEVTKNPISKSKVASNSGILFVNDGSKDQTWEIIQTEYNNNPYVYGLGLAGNVGHQNALFAGIQTAAEICDVSISIDADLQDDMELAESMMKYVIGYVLEHAPEEMKFFNQFVDKGLLERLEHVRTSDFGRVTYTEAIELLEKHNDEFDYKVSWGCDLQTEHERYLTEKIFKRPVFVTDYPKDIKAFYMKQNPDGKTVAAMDMLVPGIGEIIGGSERENDYDKLLTRMKELGLKEEDYSFYLDLRKYGSTRHAGFGLGFERCVMYLTGMGNIRDVIPFPRTVNNCEL